jgi:hypothetical protein
MHNAPMSALPKTLAPEISHRVIRIQALIWMSVDALVSLGAAWVARSPALLGFGGWNFCAPQPQKVLFINLIEDRHHRVLDDFIFQRSDP